MSNSWDDYFALYSDWDDSHCFNVRVELRFEEKLKNLGYVENVITDDFYMSENKFSI